MSKWGVDSEWAMIMCGGGGAKSAYARKTDGTCRIPLTGSLPWFSFGRGTSHSNFRDTLLNYEGALYLQKNAIIIHSLRLSYDGRHLSRPVRLTVNNQVNCTIWILQWQTTDFQENVYFFTWGNAKKVNTAVDKLPSLLSRHFEELYARVPEGGKFDGEHIACYLSAVFRFNLTHFWLICMGFRSRDQSQDYRALLCSASTSLTFSKVSKFVSSTYLFYLI